MWSPMYDCEKLVGFHCQEHRTTFHAVVPETCHCCDVRTSSIEIELQHPAAEGDTDAISQTATAATSQAENPQNI